MLEKNKDKIADITSQGLSDVVRLGFDENRTNVALLDIWMRRTYLMRVVREIYERGWFLDGDLSPVSEVYDENPEYRSLCDMLHLGIKQLKAVPIRVERGSFVPTYAYMDGN